MCSPDFKGLLYVKACKAATVTKVQLKVIDESVGYLGTLVKRWKPGCLITSCIPSINYETPITFNDSQQFGYQFEQGLSIDHKKHRDQQLSVSNLTLSGIPQFHFPNYSYNFMPSILG